MKKEMHPSTAKVLKFVQKFFRDGEVLAYDRIGTGVSLSRETTRQHVLKLAKSRLLKVKGGHIVGVKK